MIDSMLVYGLYLLTGMAAGLSAGLLGIGGGLIIVPILFLVLTHQGIATEHVMHMALATSLATIIVTSLSSAYAHHRHRAVIWPVVIQLAPGIVAGAWLGGVLAGELSSDILRPVFGIFELIVAALLLLKLQPQSHEKAISTQRNISGGIAIGTVSSIVGIGGGTLTVPFLLWHNVSIRNAVATSAACGFPIAVAGTAAYIYSGWHYTDESVVSLGYVNLTAFTLIIATSIITAPVGARLAHKMPEQLLRTFFALLLIAIGIRMIVFQ
jgi:uncharacterized membrane protein YfcA